MTVGDGRIAPSGEQVEISFGDQLAVVVEVGGGLRSYTAAGRDVLDGYGVDQPSASGRGQVVFTGDTRPDVNRRSLAVEPMSCPPNAFRTGDSVIRLEPSESTTAAWGIASS